MILALTASAAAPVASAQDEKTIAIESGLFVKKLFDKAYYSRLVARPDYMGGGYRGSIGRDFHRYFGAEITLNLF